MEGDSNPAWNLNLDGKTIFQILLSSWWWYFLILAWNITRSSYRSSTSSAISPRSFMVFIIIDWFLTKMSGDVDTKLGKDWRDLRIVKELSAQVIDSDGHTRGGRSYKSLQQCSAFPAYLISLCVSMSGQVLDISIIGLTIGGLVHMVPLSLFTRNDTTLMCVRLSKAEVGFDWQLYVTTHSSLVAFCWVWPSTIFTRAIRRIHITAQ